MASSTAGDAGDDPEPEIRLVKAGEWWVATDVATNVTTQGRTRSAALENLDDAVSLYCDESGRPPTDQELRDVGIDPADNVTGETEPPDVID